MTQTQNYVQDMDDAYNECKEIDGEYQTKK